MVMICIINYNNYISSVINISREEYWPEPELNDYAIIAQLHWNQEIQI